MQDFPPNFLVRKFSLNGQFPQISGESPENLQRMSAYGKFPHKEIIWKRLHFKQYLLLV